MCFPFNILDSPRMFIDMRTNLFINIAVLFVMEPGQTYFHQKFYSVFSCVVDGACAPPAALIQFLTAQGVVVSCTDCYSFLIFHSVLSCIIFILSSLC